MAGETVLTVVGNVYLAAFAWLDGSLGKGGYRTAATCKGLMNDKGCRTGIDKREGTFYYGIQLAELTEVVAKGIELDFGIVFRL